MTSFISFARRRNHDSSIDSICTKCYQTIASAENESTLTACEETHLCNPNAEFNQPHRYTATEREGPMKSAKEVDKFLSTIDSIQSRFRDAVVIQQRLDNANDTQEPVADRESSPALTRYVDSQRGTF
jgi:hypothetical protein